MVINNFYFPHDLFTGKKKKKGLLLLGALFAPASWTNVSCPQDHLLSVHHELSNAAPDVDTQATGNWYGQEIHIISLR